MVYVRWHNMTGALALHEEERRFYLIDARNKFDAYVPGKTALAEQGFGAKAEGLGEPTAPDDVSAVPVDAIQSPQIDNPSAELENPFLNEDL